MHRLKKVSALLLAAGSSSRYGSDNKLLALYRDKPLINHTAELITSTDAFERVVAITGCDNEAIEANLEPYAIQCLHNDQYNTGMASSVKLGISELNESDAIMVFPGDMPNITPQVIDSLLTAVAAELTSSPIEAEQDATPSVAILVPTRAGKRGNPVLLLKRCFASAMAMSGDRGARQLFAEFENELVEVEVDCQGIHQDVDHPADIR